MRRMAAGFTREQPDHSTKGSSCLIAVAEALNDDYKDRQGSLVKLAIFSCQCLCEAERDVIVRWNSEEIFEVKPYQASLLPNSLIGRFLTTCVDLVLTPTM
jgi:hypothetical protein